METHHTCDWPLMINRGTNFRTLIKSICLFTFMTQFGQRSKLQPTFCRLKTHQKAFYSIGQSRPAGRPAGDSKFALICLDSLCTTTTTTRESRDCYNLIAENFSPSLLARSFGRWWCWCVSVTRLGDFGKFLATNFLNKSCPNIWWDFELFSKNRTFI